MRKLGPVFLCVCVAISIPSHSEEQKDSGGVPRSFERKGVVAQEDLSVSALESSLFEFVSGDQWVFDKRIEGQDLVFTDVQKRRMTLVVQSSKNLVTSDDRLLIGTCDRTRLVKNVKNKYGVDSGEHKYFSHNKGHACYLKFSYRGDNCVIATYAFDYGRSAGVYRMAPNITPYDLVVTGYYCATRAEVDEFLLFLSKLRPATNSENITWLNKRRFQ